MAKTFYLRRPDPRAPGGYEYLHWSHDIGGKMLYQLVELPTNVGAAEFDSAVAYYGQFQGYESEVARRNER